MKPNYDDIKSRIPDAPKWYDSNGVPRYCDFVPGASPNIYSNFVGLFLVECQECGARFRVEMHADVFTDPKTLNPKEWHYGDPPIHPCVAGCTMNSIVVEVLEFWIRSHTGNYEWHHCKKHEGPIGEVCDE